MKVAVGLHRYGIEDWAEVTSQMWSYIAGSRIVNVRCKGRSRSGCEASASWKSSVPPEWR